MKSKRKTTRWVLQYRINGKYYDGYGYYRDLKDAKLYVTRSGATECLESKRERIVRVSVEAVS